MSGQRGMVNVWRSTNVHLAGVPAMEVKVLPDMEGVAAKFDLNKVFQTRNLAVRDLGTEQFMPLNVWTRNGMQSVPVRLIGSRTPAATKGSPATCISRVAAAPITKRDTLEIVGVQPDRIDACAEELDLFVSVSQLKYSTDLQFSLNGNLAEPKEGFAIPISSKYKGSSRVYAVRFSKGPFTKGKDVSAVTLVAVDGAHVASAPVRVAACKAGKEEAAKPVPKPQLAQNWTKASKFDDTEIAFMVHPKALPGRDLNVSNIRIGVLPEGAPAKRKWMESSGAPFIPPGGKDYQASFAIKRKEETDVWDRFSIKPTTLKAAIVTKAKDSSQAVEEIGELVLYEPNAVTKVQLGAPSVFDGKPLENVTLTFPEKALIAFPDLKTAVLSAELLSDQNRAVSGIVLTITPSQPQAKLDKGNSAKVTIALDKDSQQVWNRLPSGKGTIRLKFAGGVKVPELEGSLKWQK